MEFLKSIPKYFVRGLVYLAPIGITIYIAYTIVTSVNEILHIEEYPGLGPAIVLFLITLLGFLGSLLISSPLINRLEEWIIKIPLVSIIYTSIKDLVGAFGDKNKFNKPVMVQFDKNMDVFKPGFVTQEDLSALDLDGFVAVYMPHSYNFSGNIFMVPKENVKQVDRVASVDFMKFVVSGGVTPIKPKLHKGRVEKLRETAKQKRLEQKK